MIEIFIVVVFSAILFSIRKKQYYRLSPMKLCLVYWVSVCVVSLAFSSFNYYSIGYVLVFVFCMLFSTGFALSSGLKSRSKRFGMFRYNTLIDTRLAKVSIIVLPIGVLSLTGTLALTGTAISSFDDLNSVSADLTQRRYSAERPPITVTIALSFVYFGALICGWLLAGRASLIASKQNLLLYWPLVLSLAYAVLTTARATFLYTIIMFFSSFIVSGVYREASRLDRRKRNFNRKFYQVCVSLVLLGSVSFFLIGLLRIQNDQALTLLIGKIEAYFAAIQGLHIWFVNRGGYAELTLGSYTFAGLFELLGLTIREVGLVQEYYHTELGNVSNLYTLFRWLIEDFSLFGSLFIIMCVGIFSGTCWRIMHYGNLTAAVLMVCLYCVILWSSISSILAYNSIILAMLLFGAVMAFSAVGKGSFGK